MISGCGIISNSYNRRDTELMWSADLPAILPIWRVTAAVKI